MFKDKDQVLRDVITTFNEHLQNVHPDRRPDAIYDLLGATFDAGGSYYHSELQQYRGALAETMMLLQNLVDDCKFRWTSAASMFGDRTAWELLSNDLRVKVTAALDKYMKRET